MDAVMACESFIKDCDELYASYLISSMFATEGAGMDNVKRMAHQAWEAIKALVRRIGEALSKAGAAVGGLFKKIGEARRRVPDVIVLKKKDYKVYDSVSVGITNLGDIDIDNADRIVDDIIRSAEEINRMSKEQAETASKVDEAVGSVEEMIKKMQDEIRRKMDGNETIVFESFGLSVAMEADDGTQKVKAGPLRDTLAKLSEKCHRAMTKINSAINTLKAKINQSSSDESAAGIKKQKLFARLLKMLSGLGGNIKSFAGNIGKRFSDLITLIRRGKSAVSDYDGPEPEFS